MVFKKTAMNIRQFQEGDRQSVIELWQDCNLTRPWNDPNKDIDRKINFQPELFFVGTIEDQVVASAMAGYDGHRGSIYYFAVHPDFQGSGLAHTLIDYIESQLLELNCPKINTLVRTSNEGVLGFYQKLSYSIDDAISIGKRLIPDN